MLRRSAPLLLTLALLVPSCTPEVCELENLPHLGQPQTAAQLFELVQYAARNDCCESMYGGLSARTRAEHSETKFCLFWESIKLPEPFEAYKLADVVRRGEFLAVLPDAHGRQFMFVHYQEPGEVALDAQLYVVFEQDEQGRTRPRLGLQEQVDSQGTRDWMPFAQPPAK